MRPRRGGWLVPDSGQAMVEYAVILALTSLAIVSALLLLRASIGNTISGSSRQVDAAGSGGGYAPGTGSTGAVPGGAATGTDGVEVGDGGGGYGKGHGNGKGNSGNGNGNGGPNGRKD
jgi:Flp pilus assembly pilin Flp